MIAADVTAWEYSTRSASRFPESPQLGHNVGMSELTLNPYPTVTPLTLPCTILQLRNWVKETDKLLLGDNSSVIGFAASALAVTG